MPVPMPVPAGAPMQTDPPVSLTPWAQPTAAGRAGMPGPDILAEITAGLAAGSDLDALLGRFLAPIIQIAGAHAGAVRVLAEDGARLHLVASLGLPGAVAEAERAVEGDCGVCGMAALGDKPQWTDDLRPCVRRSDGAYFGAGCQRVLAVPLHHRGRLLGIYNLFFDGRQAPAPEVLALLKTVGDLLGLALDNVRLERENLQAMVVHERQAMAADVHDSLGQQLAFVRMRLPLLRDAIGQAARTGQVHAAEGYLDEVRGAVNQAHGSLRGILAHCHDRTMDPLGLSHALAAGVQAVRQRGTVLDLDARLPGLNLPPDQALQVFYILQEALSNVARHAGARQAWLHVDEPVPGQLVLRVEDDGQGLPEGAGGEQDAVSSTHYGLAVMRERARRIGGTLEVSARTGGGTRVRLTLPRATPTPSPAVSDSQVH
jgi:two-component system, NarL family, nitrate/nitrite sensor histidine kinase NarX